MENIFLKKEGDVSKTFKMNGEVERKVTFLLPSSGDLGSAAIEGVGIMRGEDKQPEVGVILFNMGAVDKHLYSEVANMKLDVGDVLLENLYLPKVAIMKLDEGD